MLKIRNPRGDRSVLVRELLPEATEPGVREAFWDEEAGALRVPLAPASQASRG
ncbi:hypothetical protein [Thermus scotoductus]|uniref:hypothetical protein n=1 Tax=Thermus scotoductus TaxID=37636 RepID=UPI0002FC3B08|nr:hypothetical protein [Thermus scotoductus]